jgi:chromosome segregation ATPase
MDERALAEVRRIEQRDAELADAAARLRELAGEAEKLGARAAEIERFFAGYGDDEERRRAATAEARDELGRRRGAAARAREELRTVRGEEDRAVAERAVTRADDRVRLAGARLDQAISAEAELEQSASAFSAELPSLESRAREATTELPELPPPPVGTRELIQWASAARATLFVAIGQRDQQRERLIREANELGTMLLGEPVYGATTAQVRQRVEASR